MGQSLNRILSIRFNRVFLGGCVLPQDFPWPERFAAGQVRAVLNAFTSTDSVVGLLCNALRGVGRKDVGTAGYDSFTSVVPEKLSDFPCAGRGHGAAFNSPAKLKRITAFILGGPTTDNSERPSNPFPRILVQAAKYTWVFVVMLFVLLFWNFGPLVGSIVALVTLLIIAFLLSII
jgi:hypothetical protein